MYTRHGHHIPGTTIEDVEIHRNRKIVLCGGIHLCDVCMLDVQKAQYELVAPEEED